VGHVPEFFVRRILTNSSTLVIEPSFMSAPSLSEWSMVEGDQTAEVAESLRNVQAALPEARQAADLSLPNTPVQEFVAVFTMLLIFG